MKTYKLYGTKYALDKDIRGAVPDCFALNGNISYDKPEKGKCVGYVIMEEDSVVECYKTKNIIPFILIALVVVAAGGYFAFNSWVNSRCDDIMIGTLVSEKVGGTSVVFNGIMSYDASGAVDIRYVNGSDDVTLTLSGDGIEPTSVTVKAGEIVQSIPCTFTGDSNVVAATLTIDNAVQQSSFNVLIEKEDLTGTEPQGLRGYFDNEVLFDEEN